jgi:hypothetical protein
MPADPPVRQEVAPKIHEEEEAHHHEEEYQPARRSHHTMLPDTPAIANHDHDVGPGGMSNPDAGPKTSALGTCRPMTGA